MMRFCLICMMCLFSVGANATSLPGERMTDPVLEKKARAIYRDIRCVVCQSESIADSGADVAKDMRAVIREKVKAGDSRRDILDYLQSRYGDAVLMRPPVQPTTWLLWTGPFIVLICGALGAALLFWRGKA